MVDPDPVSKMQSGIRSANVDVLCLTNCFLVCAWPSGCSPRRGRIQYCGPFNKKRKNAPSGIGSEKDWKFKSCGSMVLTYDEGRTDMFAPFFDRTSCLQNCLDAPFGNWKERILSRCRRTCQMEKMEDLHLADLCWSYLLKLIMVSWHSSDPVEARPWQLTPFRSREQASPQISLGSCNFLAHVLVSWRAHDQRATFFAKMPDVPPTKDSVSRSKL